MITVNSLSGGKTSSFMAIHYPADVEIFACVCIDYPPAAPKDSGVLNYALEKLNGNFIATAEHEKTLRVMMQLEQKIGKEIVWVRGPSFDQVIKSAGCLPTWKRRFCTTALKIIPIFEYVYPRFDKVIMQIGFRGDEFERIKKAQEPEKSMMRYPIARRIEYWGGYHWPKRQIWKEIEWREPAFPLSKTYHHDVIKFWKQYPEFDFPIDSNCRGCHHKPPELIKQNWIETPEILEWFAEKEKEKEKESEGRKFHTWKDSGVSYYEIFQMNFTEKIDFDFTMCNSGGCTD